MWSENPGHFDLSFDIFLSTTNPEVFFRIHAESHAGFQVIRFPKADPNGPGCGFDSTNHTIRNFKAQFFQVIDFVFQDIDPNFQTGNLTVECFPLFFP